jgi:exodeoxyribonuclease VII small subunit
MDGSPQAVDALMTAFPSDELTFEQALAQLEEIVRDLEDGQTGLEESLARYEQGVGLLKRCYGQLRQAEQRILLLTGADADGNPVTEPFEHSASIEALKPDARKRRKKSDESEKLF